MFNKNCSFEGLSSAISDSYSYFKNSLADNINKDSIIGIGNEKFHQTADKIKSLVTVDNLAQASIAASIAVGGAIAFSGVSPYNIIDGITTGSAGAALATTAWGVASLIRGEKNEGIKKLLVGGILCTLAIKANQLNPYSIYERNYAINKLQDELSELKLECKITKNDLLNVNNKLLSANAKLAEFENLNIDKEGYLKLFIENTKCNKDLSQSKAQVKSLLSRGLLDRLSNKEPEVIADDYDDEESPFANRHITFGTTYVKDPSRESMAEVINANHMEYAQTWKIKHKVVEDNLLIGKCQVQGWAGRVKNVDCAPYWNKVAVLRNWLNEPKKQKEEWYILVDDDMPVTNMNFDPNEAIDLLRQGKDTSLIIARDVSLWKDGDKQLSVNTGLFMVRKDEKARELIEKLWEKRNSPTGSYNDICKTLGTCKNQDVLHEQEAFARVIKEDRSLINKVITIVNPRGTYQGIDIALNTFNREGDFIRKQKNWKEECFNYNKPDAGYTDGKWKPGDWMGQTAGVPSFGWFCQDKENGLPPGPIREDRIKIMISQAVKYNKVT